MKPTVYIETTIPSYLTAWPSRDLVRAAHQQLTREWWARRDEYELFVSEIVLVECRTGDPTAAADRMAALDGVPSLDQSPLIDTLAGALIAEVPIPVKAAADAFHIAAINGGRHVAPCFGGDTVYAWSEVLDTAELPGRSDIGALRVRLVAVKNGNCAAFPLHDAQGHYQAGVILDLDLWLVLPR